MAGRAPFPPDPLATLAPAHAVAATRTIGGDRPALVEDGRAPGGMPVHRALEPIQHGIPRHLLGD